MDFEVFQTPLQVSGAKKIQIPGAKSLRRSADMRYKKNPDTSCKKLEKACRYEAQNRKASIP